mmetsp:Transcript_58027/g.149357  ORF Transcript_58027/g.149357 Transcript_58027/m.149357 type:complete len:236 (-) Transcript_58027:948-1655(-)
MLNEGWQHLFHRVLETVLLRNPTCTWRGRMCDSRPKSSRNSEQYSSTICGFVSQPWMSKAYLAKTYEIMKMTICSKRIVNISVECCWWKLLLWLSLMSTVFAMETDVVCWLAWVRIVELRAVATGPLVSSAWRESSAIDAELVLYQRPCSPAKRSMRATLLRTTQPIKNRMTRTITMKTGVAAVMSTCAKRHSSSKITRTPRTASHVVRCTTMESRMPSSTLSARYALKAKRDSV